MAYSMKILESNIWGSMFGILPGGLCSPQPRWFRIIVVIGWYKTALRLVNGLLTLGLFLFNDGFLSVMMFFVGE